MKDNRISDLNSILKSLKDDFFRNNTPKTASNEVASIYHFLPLESDELLELRSNELLSLESRLAIMNKCREFKALLKIGKHVFVDSYSKEFNSDIDFNKDSVRRCLHYIVDASYSANDYNNCILFGEKLFNEIEYNSNASFDPDRKDVLMALSMAYGRISQYDKSDYYAYLANKKPEPKIDPEIKNYKTDEANELFLLRGVIDNIKLGSKIEHVIQILGPPEKRKDSDAIYDIPQSTYLKYYLRGIELLFNEGILSSIWLKKGKNYGDYKEEELFTNYLGSLGNNISLDSNIGDIESIYGKALKEITLWNDSKIPFKICRYKSFDINVIIRTGEIVAVRLSSNLKI